MTGDTVIRIDTGRIGRNMDAIRVMAGDNVAVMAVIKANGYGHGAVGIAPTLIEHGARYLAVARLEEAVELRQKYPDYPLFILGYTPDRLLPEVVKLDITQTIWSEKQAKLLGKAAVALGKTATVHLKVDTGFHRLGTDDTAELEHICHMDGLYVEGIFSHLALTSREDDEIQLSRFMSIVNRLESQGIIFKYKHIADSISGVDYPDFRLDMIRPGALIYGLVGYKTNNVRVEQAISFVTHISQIHTLHAGEGVSYDYLWKADRDGTRVATLPFGYADGYPRNMRGKGYVTIRGNKCPLVGVLCMDQVICDISAVPDAIEGDEAVIYGDGSGNTMSIQEASKLADTNKNEIVARLTLRPARVYI